MACSERIEELASRKITSGTTGMNTMYAKYGISRCRRYNIRGVTTGGAASITGKNHNAHKPVKWKFLFFI